MSKFSALATMLCTMTALPSIYFREKQAEEAKEKAEAKADIPKPPELKPGQKAKFNPLDRRWRIYTPKQPKYRVVFDTDEVVYLERRFRNAQLTEARNELQAMKHPGKKKYQVRAQVARAEADACAQTLNEIKAQL